CSPCSRCSAQALTALGDTTIGPTATATPNTATTPAPNRPSRSGVLISPALRDIAGLLDGREDRPIVELHLGADDETAGHGRHVHRLHTGQLGDFLTHGQLAVPARHSGHLVFEHVHRLVHSIRGWGITL